MRRIIVALIALTLAGLGAAAARAGIGPCKPEDREDMEKSFVCGSGDGAARIIQKTISPSKRLALAWRNTGAPPTVVPEENDPDIELVIVRLKDGAILWKADGAYWDTGDTHINNVFEEATWSPDSRLLIETSDSRYSSDAVNLFAIGSDDAVTGPFDLLKVLAPAVRAQMKDVKDANGYDFFISLDQPMTIDNRGLIHATIIMSPGKFGPYRYYKMTAQITRRGGALGAKVLSVSLSHIDTLQ